MDDLHYAHQDWLVTEYAVADPVEDIAESKNFLYEYFELVELRAEIVTRPYA